MRFCIIHNYISPIYNGIYTTHDALITKVEQHGIFSANKRTDYFFQFIVFSGVSTHHSGTHRVTHSIHSGGLSIYPSHFGMVYKTEVVVKTPYNHFLSSETHSRSQLTIQLRKCKITVCPVHMLTKRSTVLY